MKKFFNLKIIAWGGVFLLLLAVVLFFYMTLDLPQLPKDISQLSFTTATSFYADNGELLSQLGDRRMVQLSQVSKYFQQAIVAVEDASFYKHHGWNKRGLLRALLTDIRHMRIVEGGSSITQQVAKNLFFSFDQNFSRKFSEMILALQLERQFSKDDILQAYVNQICFGPGIYGIEMAAQSYFAKHADELNLAEAAFLANVPRSPANYRPYENYELVKRRQEIVLRRMEAVGFISPEQKEAALTQPLNLRRLNLNYGQANYFLSYVRSLTEEKFGRDVVNHGDLKVYTTLDPRLQALANDAIARKMDDLDKAFGLPKYDDAPLQERKNYPQAALVAIEPRTGDVKALVGGRDFRISEFNRVIQSNRLPGSSFKPIVYLTAIDQGNYTPATVIVDEPVHYGGGREKYEPKNFDLRYEGPMVLKYALMKSRNVPAVKTLADIGPENAIKTARKLGISSTLEPDLSLALGSYGVSPLEMASAYSVFANEGVHFTPRIIRRIDGPDGRILENFSPDSHREFDEQSIYLLVNMMEGVFEDGTARAARSWGFRRPAAGKTGTTNDYRDAWFVGFTPQLVVAVWVGFDDNRVMRDQNRVGITGGRGALPIWVAFMNEALKGQLSKSFPQPAGIIFENIDLKTGKPVSSGNMESIRVALKYGTKLE